MSELKERKPDGGLADLIEFYEEMGGEDDGEMLVLLLELRAFRRTRDKERERIAELEAELARRDEAAGEPVAWQFLGDSGKWTDIYDPAEATRYGYKVRGLFPAAQPSALPPEIVRNINGLGFYQGRLIFAGAAGWYNQAIADAKALGCKAIKLPEPYDDGHGNEWIPRSATIQTLKALGFTVEGE